jgi:hypothetical protein
MQRKRPPLEAARVLRSKKVEANAEAVRHAAEAAERGRGEATRAEEAEQSARRELERTEREERASLESTFDARDLAQLAAFEVGHALERDRLAARTAAAARDAEKASAEELARRSTLALARADLDAVEKHQARWRTSEEKRAQEKADEAAEESHAARRRR